MAWPLLAIPDARNVVALVHVQLVLPDRLAPQSDSLSPRVPLRARKLGTPL
jgi:hypothetical protein